MGWFDSPPEGVIKRLPDDAMPAAFAVWEFANQRMVHEASRLRREAIAAVLIGTWANAHYLDGRMPLTVKTNSWVVKQCINWRKLFRGDDEIIFRGLIRILIDDGVFPASFSLK